MNSRHSTIAHPVARRPHPPAPAKTWLIGAAIFLVIGIIGSIAIDILSGHGPLVAILALILVPIALALTAFGLHRSTARVRRLFSQLRWWHWVWFLAFASALVFRVRGVNDIEANPVDAWAMYRIALEAVIAAVLFTHLALRRTPWFGSMFRGFVGVLTVLGLIDLASTAWSVYPSWTFYKSCEYLMDIAILAAVLVAVGSVEKYRHFFNWTWVLYGALLLTAWDGVIWWTQQALYPTGLSIGTIGVRLSGVVPDISSNDIGTYAGVLCLIALARLLPLDRKKTDRAWYLLLFAASALTMILSQTRSAIAGFLLGVFLILLFSKRLGLSAFLTFVLGPLLVASSLGGVVWSFLQRGQNARQLEHLSSRLNWWAFGWQTFLERPLLGFGAYAGGRFAVLAKLGMGETSSMHSDYVSVIVDTGIWGLIPLLIALIGVWWFLARYLRRSSAATMDQQLAYEAIAVLGLLTVRSIFAPTMIWHPPLLFLVVLGYAEYLRRRRLRPAHSVASANRQPELAAVSSET